MATDDLVGRLEKLIDESALEAADFTKNLVRTTFNRPIFSDKVPKEEQMLQYEMMKDDPEALIQFFTDQTASVDSAIKYIKEMEKRRAAG